MRRVMLLDPTPMRGEAPCPALPVEATPEAIVDRLERDGIAILHGLFSSETLSRAQRAIAARLKHVAFNGHPGYANPTGFRHLVHDLLAVSPAFAEMALDPLVLDVLDEVIGPRQALMEAKGWRTLATQYDFHGWHADAWYAPTTGPAPRELKLGVYLTDVVSGAFAYATGSHGRGELGHWKGEALEALLADHPPVKVLGPAGTAILFDSSGVHRQLSPCMVARDAAFFVFHDPAVPVQDEDLAAHRYRPLVMTADALPAPPIDPRVARVLGLGDTERRRWAPGEVPRRPERGHRQARHIDRLQALSIQGASLADRVARRLRRAGSR